MRHTLLVSIALLCTGSCSRFTASVSRQASGPPKEEINYILREVDEAGTYDTPDLPMREQNTYAGTSQIVMPYRHIEPYKEHFLKQMEYTGAGRGVAEPENVHSVKIGFIGPIESTVSVATGGKSHEEKLGIKMLQGCKLAIEEANAEGGYRKRGIPFELVVKNDNGLWGASGNEIIDLAYKDKVWAILGTIDGANSHIAIRVALKAEIVVMNSGDTDPTFTETNIPWVFRCISDDRQQGYLLVDYMYGKLDLNRVGIIRSSNRYGRFGVREIKDGSRRLGRPIQIEMAYELGLNDFSMHINRLDKEKLDAIVHWGDAAEGARILNQMRSIGMDQPFFACDRCLSDEFLQIAGENAEGVVCTSSWNPTRKSKALEQFRRSFRSRFEEKAETFAAHAYDGMNMLIWAIRTAGLNRAKIRDVLAYRQSSYDGVTGAITLSPTLDDVGEVYLARYEDGQWIYHGRDDLQIESDKLLRLARVSRQRK